jgi:FlgD Ig-like domain
MNRILFSFAVMIWILIPGHSEAADTGPRLFFLHHSTGRNLLQQGNARDYLTTINTAKNSNLVLWDHDYNYIGLADYDGDLLGYDYSIPNDNTDPDGLHVLWTTANSARDSLLARNDVIAFKSCYPASNITSEAQLNQYKQWYLEIRDFLDTQPNKTFIIMSQPPLHRLATNSEDAQRARRFSVWLMSDEYLSGHSNLVGFDFFDLLANPDDQSSTSNMLRYEYEISHTGNDSHPNTLANQTNAPLFIDVLVKAALPSASAVQVNPSPIVLHGNHPNPFNPATMISFSVGQQEWVDIQVVDLRGQKVRTLWQGDLAEGDHQLLWDGRDDQNQSVSSGLFFYQVSTQKSTVTGKMVLVR